MDSLPRDCCPVCGYQFDSEEIEDVRDKKVDQLTCGSRFGPHWSGDLDELITEDDDYLWVQ